MIIIYLKLKLKKKFINIFLFIKTQNLLYI